MLTTPNLVEILAHLGDGLSVFDSDRQVLFANDKALEILRAAEPAFHDSISNALNAGVPRRFECFHIGLNRWFEHQTYPNSDGGMAVLSRDITSRHRMEDALRSSEERFRRLIDANIIGVVVADEEVITEANDVFLGMIGRRRDELVRKELRWKDMTPREYNEVDAAAQHELKTTGVFSPYEKELIRKDGTRVAILSGGIVTNKEPIEALCFVLDQSQLKRGEQQVRSILECARILAQSLEYEDTFLELAEFLVSKLADCCMVFIKEDNTLRRIARTYAVPSSKSEPKLDLESVLASGKSQLIGGPPSVALIPIHSHNEITGVLALISENAGAYSSEDLQFFYLVAGRMGLALESSRLYHEAQRANRLKDEFVALVSHELRTPLTPILGGVYMLRTESHDEKVVQTALNLIERNAKTQVKIVNDLLDISRIVSGKLRLNMEPVDLDNVIKAALETVRPASEAKRIEIELRVQPLGAVIQGDFDRLQQIVWNLLANAVKFTPAGGRITVEVHEDSGYAELRVSDTGIGIDADFLPYVFERFRQANTSRTRVHGGLGLGLSIVRHLVESHGGTVHAESSGDEQGATFIVRLPVRTAARAAKV